MSFVPHRIFYVDDPTGEKEAFAEIIPAHQDCKLKLSIPLSLLQLRSEDEQSLHERYYVPKKYFEKLSIAIHVDEQLADDNLLDRESITQEEFGLASN